MYTVLVLMYCVYIMLLILFIIFILFRIGPSKSKFEFIILSPKTYPSPLPTQHLTLYPQTQIKAQIQTQT